jgi:heme-degrading monooxygenase HmoA
MNERGNSPKITILSTVEVQPGREQDFEQLWREAHPQPDHFPGLCTDQLLRDTNQRGRYVYVSEWDSREHFDAYVRASELIWLLEDTESWIVPQGWAHCEDVG